MKNINDINVSIQNYIKNVNSNISNDYIKNVFFIDMDDTICLQ